MALVKKSLLSSSHLSSLACMPLIFFPRRPNISPSQLLRFIASGLFAQRSRKTSRGERISKLGSAALSRLLALRMGPSLPAWSLRVTLSTKGVMPEMV